MATVIDALVVTLGLDLAGMKKGAGEADTVLTQLASSAQKALTIIGGLALLKQTVSNYLDAADAVGNFSRALGLDVEMVQMWGNMAERAGGSASGMQSTIKGLTEELSKLKVYGMSQQLGMWQYFGVSLKDSSGQIKTVDQMLLSLSERMEGMSAARQDIVGKKLGLDEGTIMLLQQGKKSVEELLERQKELGVYSKEDTEMARKAKIAFADLKQAWDLTAAVAMRYLVPMIRAISDALTDVVLWVRRHKEFVISFFTAVAATVGALLIPLLYKLAGAWLIAMWPILPIIAAVAALGAAIALLYDDYAIWAEGGESLFGDSWAAVEDYINSIKTGFSAVADFISQIWPQLRANIAQEFKMIAGIIEGGYETVVGILRWLTDLMTGNWSALAADGADTLNGLEMMFGAVFRRMWAPVSGLTEFIKSAFSSAVDWVLAKIQPLLEKWDAFKSAIGFGDGKSPAMPQASAAGALSPAAIAGATNNSKSVQASTKIDSITVNTQATDAKGIAGDISGAIDSQNLALAFDGGAY